MDCVKFVWLQSYLYHLARKELKRRVVSYFQTYTTSHFIFSDDRISVDILSAERIILSAERSENRLI
jgi:hypothetical protein